MEHWLTKRAYLTPQEIAIEFPDRTTYTFSQLASKAQLLAKKIYTVHTGGHIAILSDNSLDMVVTFWACTYLKQPVVFLNTRLKITEWEQQCTDADVTTLLCSSVYADKAKELEVNVFTFNMVQAEQPADVPLVSVMKPEAICSMMFTSGTTGRPKAVQQSYENHWSSAVASALNLGLLPEDKWLVCLPLFHISGLSTLIKSVIYGMPVYLLEKFNAEKIHYALMERKISIISVVSVTCSRLLERLGEDRYPSSFRCMLLGGGPAPESLLVKAAEKQVPIIQTYGMTETSSQIVTLNEKDALRKLGSAGKSLFSASLKILKEEHMDSPEQAGEILVKGPMVTPGYYQREEANQASFQEGWLRTGDMGYIDEEGFLFVIDRRSDLIISGGENVYPAEIEEILLACEGVKDAGVTARTDADWGQVPVAFVVKKEENVTEERLFAWCRERLAAFKVPKQIIFCEELPRNATNKLQRHKLKEWLEY